MGKCRTRGGEEEGRECEFAGGEDRRGGHNDATATTSTSTSEQTTTNHCALKAGKRRPAERTASDEKGKDDADEERTSKEVEDYTNNKEEDCALLLPLRPPHAATACRHRMPPRQLRHYCLCSSSGISDGSSSGLRRCAVAAADSRMPSLTPVFFVLLPECSLHVAQNTPFQGSFPPEFRRKLVLPWNDLIPTCVPPESGNFAENPDSGK